MSPAESMSAVLEARGRTTLSTAAERRRGRAWLGAFQPDRLVPMGLALAVALAGIAMVYPAKSTSFAAARRALRSGEWRNLNAVRGPAELDQVLRALVTEPAERAFVARRIFQELPAGGARRPLENVGALAAIRLSAVPLAARGDLPGLSARAAAARGATISLLTPEQFQALKPLLVVRTGGAFRGAFLLNVLILLGAFVLMQVGLHLTGRSGDRFLLPVALILSAIGFVMIVSLRDPLRDQMLFTRFAQGALLGGLALVACSLPIYERSVLRRLAFLPLLGALGLSLALVLFGSGPAGSDAKVNLLGTQPMELIRLLLVLFLAGYFSSRWVLLRELDERPLGDSSWLRGLRLPRLHHVLPVAIGVAVSIAFFFVQRDLGPALLLGALFLSLYAVTRREVGLAALGLAAVLGAFALSHAIGFPRTVSLRTAMWLDPWENGLARGDQIAHALWAFASGGLSGTGLGLGAPAMVPAAHTDLILAATGEELGFVGLLACLTLYAMLVICGFRIARRAPEAYTMFLALGLTLGLGLQTLLIAAGVTGLLPLTGVVTPFLCYGRSAQIIHFATLGILWSLSASGAAAAGGAAVSEARGRLSLAGPRPRSGPPSPAAPRALDLAFGRPRGALLAVLGAAALVVLGKLSWVQVARADRTFARGSLALQADGEHRFEYNPRLRLVAAQIPRGNVFDRNGVLLATSRWKDLTDRRSDLERLGVDLDRACLATDERHYPFGGLTYHLLGDLVSRRNWGATNTSFVERSHDAFLSGFDDHATVVTLRDPATREPRRLLRRDLSGLVPLWRHRHEPGHPSVRAVMSRSRDLTLTIDVRLQTRAAALLREQVVAAGLERGSLVVLDPDNGELLACVSYPWPTGPLRGDARLAVAAAGLGAGGTVEARPAAAGSAAASEIADSRVDPAASPLMDRARFGLYPPGSTFKVVTAAAALTENPALARARFVCRRLGGGRVGAVVEGRLVRDDVADEPHGAIAMEQATVASCNAYYAQLGRQIGWAALSGMGNKFEIAMGHPNGEAAERAHAVESAYGQAQVVATPLGMARVAAAIAAGGRLPAATAVREPTARRSVENAVIDARTAEAIGGMMRGVVTRGTARRIAGVFPPIAGKTGTAEIENAPSHAWFIGYAPFGQARRRIAFSILLENGGYGGARATELAGRIVAEARRLGIIG